MRRIKQMEEYKGLDQQCWLRTYGKVAVVERDSGMEVEDFGLTQIIERSVVKNMERD
jgi:hypothetical protein